MRRRTVPMACLALLLSAGAVSALTPPLVVHPDGEDRDWSLVFDRLEQRVDRMLVEGRGEQLVRVEVVLWEPYQARDLELFRSLGGTVLHTFEAVSYGFSGQLPAARVRELAARLAADGRLCVVSDDPPGGVTLDSVARQVRVRPYLWAQGYVGGSSTTIAVLDTGVDDSHSDFAGRVSPGWTDTTAEAYGSPVDYHGHGSHVAGIALGSGASYDLGYSGMYVVTTRSDHLPASPGSGWFDVAEVKHTGVNELQVILWWNGGGTTQVSARDPSWSWMAYQNSSSSPNVIYYTASTAGVYRPYFGNVSGAGGAACALNVVVGYEPVGDGYNLFRGMAPGATLLGVKVLASDGSGWATDWGEGLDWCVTNRDLYDIRVVNMSLALYEGATDPTLDDKVNTAVANGIVVVAAAGNDFSTYHVASPGNAAKAITVGAVNDSGAMTNYSSNGSSGQGKPDVVAPGGSTVAGTNVTSLESNDGDAFNSQLDHTPDNYRNMHGTSMATPVVAGLAGLLIDALEQDGDPWDATEAEALQVKSVILMTATETNQVGELAWNDGALPTTPSGNDPSLDRGAPDLVEGFGRVNADAAVEAMTNRYTFTHTDAVTVGEGPYDRQARAYRLSLSSGTAYDFEVKVPPGADLDLFVYDGAPDSSGRPVVAVSSATPGQADERITGWQPATSGTYHAVVKRVSGAGLVTFVGGAGGGLLFADGFESGSYLAWSDVSP